MRKTPVNSLFSSLTLSGSSAGKAGEKPGVANQTIYLNLISWNQGYSLIHNYAALCKNRVLILLDAERSLTSAPFRPWNAVILRAVGIDGIVSRS